MEEEAGEEREEEEKAAATHAEQRQRTSCSATGTSAVRCRIHPHRTQRDHRSSALRRARGSSSSSASSVDSLILPSLILLLAHCLFFALHGAADVFGAPHRRWQRRHSYRGAAEDGGRRATTTTASAVCASQPPLLHRCRLSYSSLFPDAPLTSTPSPVALSTSAVCASASSHPQPDIHSRQQLQRAKRMRGDHFPLRLNTAYGLNDPHGNDLSSAASATSDIHPRHPPHSIDCRSSKRLRVEDTLDVSIYSHRWALNAAATKRSAQPQLDSAPLSATADADDQLEASAAFRTCPPLGRGVLGVELDLLLYRLVELGQRGPCVSSYRSARVMSVDGAAQRVTLAPTGHAEEMRRIGHTTSLSRRWAVSPSIDGAEQAAEAVEMAWNELLDVRVVEGPSYTSALLAWRERRRREKKSAKWVEKQRRAAAAGLTGATPARSSTSAAVTSTSSLSPPLTFALLPSVIRGGGVIAALAAFRQRQAALYEAQAKSVVDRTKAEQ